MTDEQKILKALERIWEMLHTLDWRISHLEDMHPDPIYGD